MILTASCSGGAIGDAQRFSPNRPPAILSIKAVNLDGSKITQFDIEPFKQFKLIVEAVDADKNPLEYKFDSESGTFAGIVINTSGCTAIFKTGSIKGGQNIDLWAGVSDKKGAIVRQLFNLGTGKTGPTIVASLDRIRFKPDDSIKMLVNANCSGFFQLYCDGTGDEKFEFEKDMFRYLYGENKTTDFILAGPDCLKHADINLEKKPPYTNDTSYNLVLIFRDGLFQTGRFIQPVYVDGTPPAIADFSPGLINAGKDPEVTVTFDEEIGYADSSSLKLSPAHGSISLKSVSGNQAVFSVSGLKAVTNYTATVSGITDIAGNEMVPDSSRSFMTRIDENTRFIVKDDGGDYYRIEYSGFDVSSTTVQLKAYFDGNIASGVTYSAPVNGFFTVNADGLLTFKESKLPLADKDQSVTVTAKINSLGVSADYAVIVKAYYPVTKAEEFADGGVIAKNLNCKFMLMNDIDFALSSNDKIKPIGSQTNHFTGVFDGGGNTLSNFKIDSIAAYASLFTWNEGTIKNLVVKKAELLSEKPQNSGIICGYNKGKIENCHVEDSTAIGDLSVGGIAGVNLGTITGCTITRGWVKAVGNYIAGGIVGTNHGNVIKCRNDKAKVYANNHVGGLIGCAVSGKIEDCFSNVTIESGEGITITNNAGGLIGSAYVSIPLMLEIINCHSTGSVDVSTANNVGGLIGNAENAKISLCYSDCTITGSGKNFGGLIGYFFGIAISNCYSTSDLVVGDAITNVGGLVGLFISAKINNCYAIGDVPNVLKNHGGLVGSGNKDDITNSFRISDKGYSSNDLGTPTSDAELKSIDTYKSLWNISYTKSAATIWWIDPVANGGYPYLRSVPPK